MKTVYVAIEALHYEGSTVVGVADSVEGAKKIADAAIAKERMEFGPWKEVPYIASVTEYCRSGPYSNFYVETHELKEN